MHNSISNIGRCALSLRQLSFLIRRRNGPVASNKITHKHIALLYEVYSMRRRSRRRRQNDIFGDGFVRSQPKQPPVTPLPPGGRGGSGRTESRDLTTTTLYQTTPYTARVKRVVARFIFGCTTSCEEHTHCLVVR